MGTYSELIQRAIAIIRNAKSPELAVLELDDICESEGWLDCYGYTGQYLCQEAQRWVNQQMQEAS